MSYYTLFQREQEDSRRAGQWLPQFGDFSRTTVQEELADYRSNGVKAGNLKIIATATSATVDIRRATDRLNSVRDWRNGRFATSY